MQKKNVSFSRSNLYNLLLDRPHEKLAKNIFALAAYAWEAAPCSTLPTADENAVTESAVTTLFASLFQSATVLTKNELLYCPVLLSGILKPDVL